MFAWLVGLGPIISNIAGYFTRKIDADVEKYRIDGQVDINAVNAQIALTSAFKDHWEIRTARMLAILLPSVWFGLVAWDTIVAESNYKWLMWHVASFPPGLEYYPYAVLVFLLGNAWIKRR